MVQIHEQSIKKLKMLKSTCKKDVWIEGRLFSKNCIYNFIVEGKIYTYPSNPYIYIYIYQ